MVKLVKKFEGVPNGEIYPVTYEPGDECPEELLGAAIELGAVAKSDAKADADAKAKAEGK